MNLQAAESDRVEELMLRHGALAVTLSDAADDPVLEPLPGETPLWREICLSGLFDADVDLEALREELHGLFRGQTLPSARVETLEDRDWEREWLRDFHPMRFGRRLWVSPAGQAVDAVGAVVVRLDPGLAFGTGTHATTALCLERLDALPLEGARILDYGCGSGILAIAALMLDAALATAYDIDPQAVTAATDNALRNAVADRLSATGDAESIGSGYDVVVANILARPLAECAADIASRVTPGGTLVLSGLLDGQAPGIRRVYAPWIDFAPPTARDGWVCLCGHRRRDT